MTKRTQLTGAEATFKGQTEVMQTGWRDLADEVSEEIASQVGDIQMHHFEADLWVDDDETEYFEWKAEVKLLDIY